jgi:hypothetical protein
MKKPVNATVEWKPEDADEPIGEQITKRGRHHVKEFVEKKRLENSEQRKKWLRDLGGRELDQSRIPRPEHAESGRTWKGSSRQKYPSKLFRNNYDLVRWDQ